MTDGMGWVLMVNSQQDQPGDDAMTVNHDKISDDAAELSALAEAVFARSHSIGYQDVDRDADSKSIDGVRSLISHVFRDRVALRAERDQLRTQLAKPCGSCHPCVNYSGSKERNDSLMASLEHVTALAEAAEVERDQLRTENKRLRDEARRQQQRAEMWKDEDRITRTALGGELRSVEVERDGLRRQLDAVRAAVEKLRADENLSMWAQGESPRPKDYSEGHYTGHRAGVRTALAALDAALAVTQEAHL